MGLKGGSKRTILPVPIALSRVIWLQWPRARGIRTQGMALGVQPELTYLEQTENMGSLGEEALLRLLRL